MSIYKKLHSAKSEIGAISKDSRNPFFKSKYFDINQLLEHTEPILQKHDLLCLQPIIDGVVTSQIIDVETGEKVESGIALTNITDPQKRGSEITYYRRYTLASLLGMQAEDDDANKASRKKPAAKPVISEDQLAKATAFIESGGKISDIEIKYLLTEAQKNHLNSVG
tara:strand:+ start:2010 stop:2510 length:501 start_codon:yes stop_codon:yes gene_type:complete